MVGLRLSVVGQHIQLRHLDLGELRVEVQQLGLLLELELLLDGRVEVSHMELNLLAVLGEGLVPL